MKKPKKKSNRLLNNGNKKPKIKEEPPVMSLVERAIKEREEWVPGRGHKREIVKMAFALWSTIPVRYRGAPDSVLAILGIADPDILDLARIKNVNAFEEKFTIGKDVMARWAKELRESDDGTGEDIRSFFRKLMREGLSALYQKLIEHGDAERFKVFASYVEGWVPQMGLQHKGDVSVALTVDEKKVLDDLIKKNTK